MCGIVGFTFEDMGLAKRMCEVISHRGPDEEGYYSDKNITLAHKRLSIIDLRTGKQPIYNEDRSIVIVHNGEIYNFRELREDLEAKGHRFYTASDTEVVLHAYEEWGYNCIERFNGMWAFAIYDKNKGIVFLSRDRFGIKPLYYYWCGNKFIFSSEIKGILQHDVDKIPNDKIVYEFLAFGLVDHSRETFFKIILIE